MYQRKEYLVENKTVMKIGLLPERKRIYALSLQILETKIPIEKKKTNVTKLKSRLMFSKNKAFKNNEDLRLLNENKKVTGQIIGNPIGLVNIETEW